MLGINSPSYNQDFLIDTIGITQSFLTDLISTVQAFGEFTPDKEYFWNKRLIRLTNEISQFVELTTLLSKLVTSRSQTAITGIKESHIQLLFIVKAMKQSQQKQDYVALEELIKHELKDNLIQWKIDRIPQFKKLLTY